ncbi:MAG: hypothetical protein AB7E52_03825 [Bdellovibrionales bacterium]
MSEQHGLKERMWDFLLDGLWVDALRLVFIYMRFWFPGMVVFALIGSGLTVLGVESIALPVLAFFEIYYFARCFFRQEPPSKPVMPTFDLFIQSMIGMVALSLGYLSFVYSLPFIHGFFGDENIDAVVTIFSCIIGLWLILRLMLVPFTVIAGIEAPLPKTWRMTKGKALRLAFNFLILGMIVTPIFYLVGTFENIYLDLLVDLHLVLIFTALGCVACKVLYGEYVAATIGQDRRRGERSE